MSDYEMPRYYNAFDNKYRLHSNKRPAFFALRFHSDVNLTLIGLKRRRIELFTISADSGHLKMFADRLLAYIKGTSEVGLIPSPNRDFIPQGIVKLFIFRSEVVNNKRLHKFNVSLLKGQESFDLNLLAYYRSFMHEVYNLIVTYGGKRCDDNHEHAWIPTKNWTIFKRGINEVTKLRPVLARVVEMPHEDVNMNKTTLRNLEGKNARFIRVRLI